MKKDHMDGQNPRDPQPFDMLKTFSALMSGGENRSLPKNEPKAAAVPEGYNNKKFEKLIREHDRISREIDRKYNGGRPPKAGA